MSWLFSKDFGNALTAPWFSYIDDNCNLDPLYFGAKNLQVLVMSSIVFYVLQLHDRRNP